MGGHFYFSEEDRIKHTLSPHTTPPTKTKKSDRKIDRFSWATWIRTAAMGNHCKVEPIPTSAGHKAEQ